ncbi:MAG: hypothetical protein R3C56_09690 [Pirellulaceae bacterium]
MFLIAITPTPARFGAWEQINQVNTLMSEYCHEHEGVYYIDTVSSYLDADGQPIKDYFIKDGLHQNRKGYQLWAQAIKARSSQSYAPKLLRTMNRYNSQLHNSTEILACLLKFDSLLQITDETSQKSRVRKNSPAQCV